MGKEYVSARSGIKYGYQGIQRIMASAYLLGSVRRSVVWRVRRRGVVGWWLGRGAVVGVHPATAVVFARRWWWWGGMHLWRRIRSRHVRRWRIRRWWFCNWIVRLILRDRERNDAPDQEKRCQVWELHYVLPLVVSRASGLRSCVKETHKYLSVTA